MVVVEYAFRSKDIGMGMDAWRLLHGSATRSRVGFALTLKPLSMAASRVRANGRTHAATDVFSCRQAAGLLGKALDLVVFTPCTSWRRVVICGLTLPLREAR